MRGRDADSFRSPLDKLETPYYAEKMDY